LRRIRRSLNDANVDSVGQFPLEMWILGIAALVYNLATALRLADQITYVVLAITVTTPIATL
jgi:hypothetical protein